MASSPPRPDQQRLVCFAPIATAAAFVMLALLLLAIGWRCAMALDSTLLGFCSAMLAMIVGIAAYGIVHAPHRKGY